MAGTGEMALAVLRIPDEQRSLREEAEVRDYLAGIGIEYERWVTPLDLAENASTEQVLSAYALQIEELKRRGGYVTAGRGLFHIHPPKGPVVAIEVEAGDLMRVPRGTLHWFDLCGDRRIRAIRLFQDTSGWTPHYTSSGVDRNYEPVCWGPRYIPPQVAAK